MASIVKILVLYISYFSFPNHSLISTKESCSGSPLHLFHGWQVCSCGRGPFKILGCQTLSLRAAPTLKYQILKPHIINITFKKCLCFLLLLDIFLNGSKKKKKYKQQQQQKLSANSFIYSKYLLNIHLPLPEIHMDLTLVFFFSESPLLSSLCMFILLESSRAKNHTPFKQMRLTWLFLLPRSTPSVLANKSFWFFIGKLKIRSPLSSCLMVFLV